MQLQFYRRLGIVVMLLIISLGCQEEQVSFDETEIIDTVAIDEAKNYITGQLKSSNTGKSNYVVEADFDGIEQEEIFDSNKLLTVVPARIEGRTTNSRILLLKIKDSLQSVVITMLPFSSEDEDKFSGRVFISDLDGGFINSMTVEDNKVVKAFEGFSSNAAGKHSKSDCLDGCPYEDCDYCYQLEEVVVTNNGPSSTNIIYIPITELYKNEEETLDEADGWNGGGGPTAVETQKACPAGYVLNENNDCVLATDPCDDIQNIITNPAIKAKLDDLKSKTNLKHETGYGRNKNGTFETLTVSPDGHSVYMPYNRNRVAFMHSHINSFEKRNSKGEIIDVYPKKMFSPADVWNFLLLVQHAKSFNTPISEIYGIMVSSRGTYVLKFTGNMDDIVTNNISFDPNDVKEDYLKYLKRGLEKGFLRFLKDKIGVQGISMYEVKNNGDIVEKALNTNNKVDDNECDN